jgi:hypothetical protein
MPGQAIELKMIRSALKSDALHPIVMKTIKWILKALRIEAQRWPVN